MYMNKESIKLYRDILRTCKLFNWPDQSGNLWSQVLKRNARNEFESAKYESDPLLVAKLILVGRESLHQVSDKLIQKNQAFRENIEKSKSS